MKDSLCEHGAVDPIDAERYCLPHAWRSWAIRVDLRPYRERMEHYLSERLGSVLSLPDAYNEQDDTVPMPTEITNQIGLVGEAATAILTGGRILPKGKGGDVRARDGHVLEVKTCYRRWPYNQYYPSAAIKRRHAPQADLVLCATEGPPRCFEYCYVIGWLPLKLWRRHAVTQKWGWFVGFSPKSGWRRVEELMDTTRIPAAGGVQRVAKPRTTERSTQEEAEEQS